MRAIIVHGGAGKWLDEKIPDAVEVIKEAVVRGFEYLGRDPISACEESIKVLEDSPVFNAGRGSVLNEKGEIEMDASIMDGKSMNAGAVGSVKNVKNPISLARIVMEKTDHTLIVCDGAYRLAVENGLDIEEDLYTNERIEQWKRLKDEIETVGAVVTDGSRIVAGTSTGGVIMKKEGRVGDSAIIGAGTYASEFSGVSATGDGDKIIRVSLSFFVNQLITVGVSPMDACRCGISLLWEKVKGKGGVIALNRKGEYGFSYNTARMPVGYMNSRSRHPKIFGV